ncbi:MAG: hypothetical protein VKL00_04550 [Synechococcales bacterium]|nr:hypothetical protein [Synechococcales bacterium]
MADTRQSQGFIGMHGSVGAGGQWHFPFFAPTGHRIPAKGETLGGRTA